MGRHSPALLLVALALLLTARAVQAAGPYRPFEVEHAGGVFQQAEEPERLIATVLAIGLGTFGAHRLYLGTSTVVPVAYALTFGGFGVLVVIDLAHLLFARDLAPYRNNRRILMWANPPGEPVTPP